MTIEAAPLAGGARVSLRRTFQALRHRDFRLYWAALIVSLLGLSFQTVAQQWLVYRLTGSALQLGIVGFIPALLSAPGSILGGLLADRVSRRRLVLITQSAMVGPPVGLALVIWSGQVQVWHIIAAASLLGFVAAIDLSVRTAMIPQLVAPQDLLNAQSLSSLVYQMARIVGPALAGLAIARVGEAVCFLINGLSYLAMVGAMAAMQLGPEAAVRERARRKGLVGSLLEGIRYTLRDRLVLGLFVVLAVQGLFLYPLVTLLPVFAKDILGGGAQSFGWLTTATGVGSLLGALAVANLGPGRRGKMLIAGGLILPFVLAAFAWSRWLPLSVPMLMLWGAGIVLITTVTATTLLTVVPDKVRGRVNSLGLLVYFGTMYAGGVPAGYLAQLSSAPVALTLSGVFALVSMLGVLLFLPQVARVE